jgi:hypothetical protein
MGKVTAVPRYSTQKKKKEKGIMEKFAFTNSGMDGSLEAQEQ